MDSDSGDQHQNVPSVTEKAAAATCDNEGIKGLDTLYQSVAPIWAEQINAARNITDTSIIDLSQRFYGLSQRIQATVQNSEQDLSGSNSLVKLLNESQSELNSVIALLRSAMEDKKALLKAVLDLSTLTKELKNMASNVSMIARQTNMVAINAAIEAAHVGEAGRGFAVVANEVKDLSSNAAATGKQISEKIRSVNEAISATTQISYAYEEKDMAIVAEAEAVVAKVIDKFSEAAQKLVASGDAMRAEGHHVSSEISQVLVDLQFQDRVSQMLSHVHGDISKLKQTIDSDIEQLDCNAWLEALAASYTMQEQHAIHQAKLNADTPLNPDSTQVKAETSANNVISITSGSRPGEAADEVTFF